MNKSLLEILAGGPNQGAVLARGWVRTKREAKGLCFIELNDGSSLKGLQCVFDLSAAPFPALAQVQTGSSLEIGGRLRPSPGKGQSLELSAESLVLIGQAPAESYPLQKKAHGFDFLRQHAHLRPRTNTFGALSRLRDELSFATHSFFRQRGFRLVHTPIITSSDCEGAGAMFRVTTLEGDAAKTLGDRGDFFGKRASLTVSGQLNAEAYATALGRVYTFGPTFRAENSNTSRHLAEFWMIEPEMAFAGLEDDMALAEDFLRHLIAWALDNCPDDLDFFDQRLHKGLVDGLRALRSAAFTRMSYDQAVTELGRSARAFEYPVSWGSDLQSEHERFLSEELVGGPLIVHDYPKDIKSFYMRQNDDGRTVRAMDVLVPRLGEIIGGSEREFRLEPLERRMRELGMSLADYQWYLDLRRFGSVPHSGFGLGFERLIQYISGMQNIRDVIPFPRAVGLLDF